MTLECDGWTDILVANVAQPETELCSDFNSDAAVVGLCYCNCVGCDVSGDACDAWSVGSSDGEILPW